MFFHKGSGIWNNPIKVRVFLFLQVLFTSTVRNNNRTPFTPCLSEHRWIIPQRLTMRHPDRPDFTTIAVRINNQQIHIFSVSIILTFRNEVVARCVHLIEKLVDWTIICPATPFELCCADNSKQADKVFIASAVCLGILHAPHYAFPPTAYRNQSEAPTCR